MCVCRPSFFSLTLSWHTFWLNASDCLKEREHKFAWSIPTHISSHNRDLQVQLGLFFCFCLIRKYTLFLSLFVAGSLHIVGPYCAMGSSLFHSLSLASTHQQFISPSVSLLILFLFSILFTSSVFYSSLFLFCLPSSIRTLIYRNPFFFHSALCISTIVIGTHVCVCCFLLLFFEIQSDIFLIHPIYS